MEIEKKLVSETEKWKNKIEIERKKIIAEKSDKLFLKNIDAYISDCSHFLEKKMFIEAFEAIIWAWAYLEIGTDRGILKKKN